MCVYVCVYVCEECVTYTLCLLGRGHLSKALSSHSTQPETCGGRGGVDGGSKESRKVSNSLSQRLVLPGGEERKEQAGREAV